MLWYKAWLETRVRFLICLLTIPIFCVYRVHSDFQRADYNIEPTFYYAVINNAYGIANALWLVTVVFLTMGGLLREQAVGAASLTLALPVTRARLMGVRIAVGAMQAITLIPVSCIAIWIESRALGTAFPISQAWFRIVLMIGGGLVFFAIAMLAASLVSGEYTAPLAALCAVIGLAIAFRDPPAQTISPFRFMSGGDYFDRTLELLTGPIPWLEAGAWVLVGAALLAASVKAIQVREF